MSECRGTRWCFWTGVSEGRVPPCLQEFLGSSPKGFSCAVHLAPRPSDMMQKIRLGILVKNIFPPDDKSVHFVIRYITIKIPKI